MQKKLLYYRKKITFTLQQIFNIINQFVIIVLLLFTQLSPTLKCLIPIFPYKKEHSSTVLLLTGLCIHYLFFLFSFLSFCHVSTPLFLCVIIVFFYILYIFDFSPLFFLLFTVYILPTSVFAHYFLSFLFYYFLTFVLLFFVCCFFFQGHVVVSGRLAIYGGPVLIFLVRVCSSPHFGVGVIVNYIYIFFFFYMMCLLFTSSHIINICSNIGLLDVCICSSYILAKLSPST